MVCEEPNEAVEVEVRTPRWLVAACALLGVGAVLAVGLWPEGPRARQVLQHPVARSTSHVVASAEELAALPADTTHLQIRGISAGEFVESVPELPHLVALELAAHGNDAMGSLDRTVLDKIGTFLSLRELSLADRTELEGSWLEPLTGLPVLARLELSRAQVGRAAVEWLARMPSLRSLDLSFNQSLSDDDLSLLLDGAPALEVLSLRGCGALSGSGLARLGEAQRLRDLDLGWVVGVDFGPALQRLRRLRDPRVRSMVFMMSSLESASTGVDDDVVAAVSRLPSLRRLSLTGCRSITADGFKALSGSQIAELDLDYLLDDGEGVVEGLPVSLTSLSLERTEIGGPDLRRIAERLDLVRLEMYGCSGLGDDTLEALLESEEFVSLGLGACSGLTVGSAPALLGEATLERLEVSELGWIDDELVEQLKAMPKLRELIRRSPGAAAPRAR